MLERLAADLEESGTHAVFYISPLNVEALKSYELFDEKRYARNVAPAARIVESHGHRFLDLNAGAPFLPRRSPTSTTPPPQAASWSRASSGSRPATR